MVFLGASCGSPKRYRKVVLYSPYGRDILQDLCEKFEAVYAEDEIPIRVEIHQFATASILERLEEERIRPRCDVWWGGEMTYFTDAKALGYLDPHPAAEIAEHMRPEHRDENYYWFGTSLSPHVILHNGRLDQSTVPQGWDDLLDPRFQGRIILRDAENSTIMQRFVCAMIAHFYEEATGPERGYNWLARLHRQCLPYATTTEELFSTLDEDREGEGTEGAAAVRQAALSIWPLADLMVRRKRYGYNFGYVVPEDGAPTFVEGIAIVRGAPHLETAKKFLDFVTSKENQLYLAGPESGYYRIPTRTDLGENLPEWLAPLNLDAIGLSVKWDLVRTHRKQWIQHWVQEIKPME